jgi:diguanylate cyclase (GGDEF)-like protein
MRERRSLLIVGSEVPAGLADSAWGPFLTRCCGTLQEATQHLADTSFDGVLLMLPSAADTHRMLAWPALSQACLDAAVLLVTDHPTPALAAELLDRGVQDVLATAVATPDAVARAANLSVGRKRLERLARRAYATDLATGLPNEMQLLEHMSHLLALREREPAPMALLALRIEGFATTAARLGTEAAGALRRKVAVRLRAGLRSSDVVASLGSDSFAVLLSSIEAPADAGRVGAKLQAALAQAFTLAGQDVALATALGIASSPADGALPSLLLRRAVGLAAAAQALGRSGYANRAEAGGAGGAANDD